MVATSRCAAAAAAATAFYFENSSQNLVLGGLTFRGGPNLGYDFINQNQIFVLHKKYSSSFHVYVLILADSTFIVVLYVCT